MTTWQQQSSSTSNLNRQSWRANRSGNPGRMQRGGFVQALAASSAGMRLPRRPDSNILSEAIPLFFVGRNNNGFWVARESGGKIGGIFMRKQSALRFAHGSTQPWGCATMFVPERFELDLENQGNLLVAHLATLMQMVSRFVQRLRGWCTKPFFMTSLPAALDFPIAFLCSDAHIARCEAAKADKAG